jgi:hypothetical protein
LAIVTAKWSSGANGLGRLQFVTLAGHGPIEAILTSFRDLVGNVSSISPHPVDLF